MRGPGIQRFASNNISIDDRLESPSKRWILLIEDSGLRIVNDGTRQRVKKEEISDSESPSGQPASFKKS
jgi:hypothetical protein